MSADPAAADVLVWLAANGVLVMGLGLLLVAASLFWRSPRREHLRENAQLRARLDVVRRTADQERHNATVAMDLANQAHGRASELAGELIDIQGALQRLYDDAVTARMEREFEGGKP